MQSLLTTGITEPEPGQHPFTVTCSAGGHLFFLHANGYPPECYQPLLDLLAQEQIVVSPRQRPLWKGSNPGEVKDWRPFSQDFLDFLEARSAREVIAVGHSLGGVVALRSALLKPELFRALILIDPVLFPPPAIHLWQLIRLLGLGEVVHPTIRATRHRRERFSSPELLFRHYRSKPVFKYMDDAALQACVQGISCPDGDGCRLCYPVEWELRVYLTSIWGDMDLWRSLPNLQMPMLIISGAETNAFWASTAKRFKRLAPGATTQIIPNSTHLVPLERPMEVAGAIQKFLKEIP